MTSRYEKLRIAQPDPIFGLKAEYVADPRSDKLDLTAGVYRDENGVTPIFEVRFPPFVETCSIRRSYVQTTK
ncbi:MAG: hypothetical protein OXH78_12795 [Acidimicrobiaceae bacterium]|nr:hypothetical protein [Acidimicrobiaceae bacterium]